MEFATTLDSSLLAGNLNHAVSALANALCPRVALRYRYPSIRNAMAILFSMASAHIELDGSAQRRLAVVEPQHRCSTATASF
jgi:hypothetical protein